MLNRFLSLVLCVAALQLTAQNVTIINNYNGGGDSLLPENYVLKSVTEHTYIVNEFEPSNTGTRSLLDQMISYGIRSYIDNSFHVFDNRAQALTATEKFTSEATALVRNALWIHELDFADEFPGFSRGLRAKVDALRGVDGFSIRHGEDAAAPASNGSIGLYTFQRMVYELKTAVEDEAMDFIDRHMPQTRKRGYDNLKGVILLPGEYQLPVQRDGRAELADLEPSSSLLLSSKGARDPSSNNRSEDESPFTQQIVNLLEENNRILADYSARFSDMQRQIDDLRENRDNDIRREMATMREMIENIASGEPSRPRSHSLPEEGAPSLIFGKNVYELTLNQKVQLNRVQITLAQNPSYRLLITGYADRTGDPAYNAWISQKRAKAVQTYLVGTGISPERLTVSFLGDAESSSPNPEDRKVVVSYVY